MKRLLLIITAFSLTMAAQTAPPAPPAVPAPQAKPSPAPAPKAPRKMYRGGESVTGTSYLGVDIRDVAQGAEITMVDQDGPAGKAGLEEHDIVTSFNGQKVQSGDQLRRLILDTKPGTRVSLGILRDGQSRTLQATLADRTKLYANMKHFGGSERIVVPSVRVHVPDIEIPSFVMVQSSRRDGLTIENLTTQLGNYFGVSNGEGVLVRSVEKGSKAEAAGLRAGDVIIRVDNERVTGTRDWFHALREHEAGTIKLGIMRDRREQTLSLTVPQASADEDSAFLPGQDWEQLRMQLDRLGPELSQQQAEIQRRIAREMAAHQKEIQKAMRDAQRELERSMRELDKEKSKDKNKDDDQ